MDYLEKSYESVCKAICLLSFKYENICVPIKPCYEFDLICCERESGVPKRIKVFRTDSKAPSGSYVVNLRKSGGYSKSNSQKKPFAPENCDHLFIDSPNGVYFIPSSRIIQTRALSLSTCEEFLLI